jgi:hypothetical protein
MAMPEALEPAPLVTRVRNRTVANVDSIGFGGAQMDPVLRGAAVELEQQLSVLGDLDHRLRVLRAEVGGGRRDRLILSRHADR